MLRVPDLFLHEDLGKSENRVNAALFALMQQNWFRQWFLKKLGLPIDAIVYPPTNRNGRRPDLKAISPTGETLAWIEVELNKDVEQIRDFQCRFRPDPVKALWGRRSHSGDLSLEEIVERLERETDIHPQIAVNTQQLVELIREGLQDHSSSPGRSALSPEMRAHPLVRELVKLLNDKILFELGGNEPPPPGYLKADTTSTPNNRGFSLRVYSPKSSDKTLSIMSISTGRPRVDFPSLPKLESYLPQCPNEVAAYKAVLCSMNLNIGRFEARQRPSLPLDVVIEELERLKPCVQMLADCYACHE